MSGAGTVVEIAYGEGWDLAARTLLGPLAPEAARARDEAGLPYVAVCRVPGGDGPAEVRLVSWRDHYAGVWVYDKQGRRTQRIELRLLDGDRLFRRETDSWLYAGPDMPEFDRACPRETVSLLPDGRGSNSWQPKGEEGSMLTTTADVSEEQRWMDRPAFGDWPLFSAQRRGLTGPVVFHDADVPEGGAVGRPEDTWRPPRPAGPDHLEALFRPGTRMSTSHFSDMTVLEPRRCGTLRVPSGVLAVDCPCNDGRPRITVAVPPGAYALEEARVSVGYDCEWTGGWVTRTDATAVRLRLSDTPAASWDMALGEDDDIRLLGDDEAYGFATDAATGCFADAAAWEPLRGLFERALIHDDPHAGEHLSDSMYILRTTDQATAADLVAFATCGDRTYPVWVGRSEAGEIVCVDVVLDYLPDLKVH
ncbi:DUF4241 domain-containing protein [Streptomyces sp. ISL-99]|uniref:DUF4241 domain-containing protein n=1 Tax=Streptomyces sp. ISL-99 TaxID=2819193 RepID=UPI001BE5E874|nr:DUF4241 domain-containing protein [Streptomyces sp. ISL-99]MBT2526720.1 DUF4241 domain-containing protein [Streptomyces sp. ISL-99]